MSDEEIDSIILLKYEILQKLGKGAYGVVWKAVDKKTREIVAIKKIIDAFSNPTDAKRTFREVTILYELGNHENIVDLLNVIKVSTNKDLYLIFDFMDTDLHAVIKAMILYEIHKKYVAYQIINCIKYIHSSDIIHRDLKPSNILLNAECFVKIADFGLARCINSSQLDFNTVLTDYVATRWYRAPEIILGSKEYSTSADMWSIGCIVAEMYLGKPIFPGSSKINQLERIFEITGIPPKAELSMIFTGVGLSMLEPLYFTVKQRHLSHLIGMASQAALKFIMRFLELDPKKRVTAKEALEDPYLAEFHDKKEEFDMSHKVVLGLDENKMYEASEYRDKLYSEIKKKKKV